MSRPQPARAAIITGLLSCLAGPAIAQAGSAAAGREIVVEAPRSVPVPVARSPYSGAAVAVTTVRITALYGDLDLARPADAARLMTRIERVARDACGQLDRLYPLAPDATCVDKAVAGARASAEAAIAAAEPAPATPIPSQR